MNLGIFHSHTTSHPGPAAKSEDLPGQKPSAIIEGENPTKIHGKIWDCLICMFS